MFEESQPKLMSFILEVTFKISKGTHNQLLSVIKLQRLSHKSCDGSLPLNISVFHTSVIKYCASNERKVNTKAVFTFMFVCCLFLMT